MYVISLVKDNILLGVGALHNDLGELIFDVALTDITLQSIHSGMYNSVGVDVGEEKGKGVDVGEEEGEFDKTFEI